MAFTTIPAAGAKLPASVLSALITELRPVSAFKTVDTSRASTVARVADPDLSVTLPADSDWDFELVLLISSAANAAGDFSGEFAYPTGAAISHLTLGLVDTLASGISADLSADGNTRDATSPSNAFDLGCSTAVVCALVSGRIEVGSTAGALTLNWAQLASNANATVVQDGSRLVARRSD